MGNVHAATRVCARVRAHVWLCVRGRVRARVHAYGCPSPAEYWADPLFNRWEQLTDTMKHQKCACLGVAVNGKKLVHATLIGMFQATHS